MATTERDYYEVLGVQRGASGAQIKRAFRALARELHPDVSSEPEAEQRFREVAEAYEVLSDPERRATYDRLGHAGLRRGGFEPTFAHFGDLSDVFAAFFGEGLFGDIAAQRRAARRRRHPGARGDRPRGRVRRHLGDRAGRGRPALRALRRDRARSPGTETRECSTCGGGGTRAPRLAERLRPVRPAAAVPGVRRPGPGRRDAVHRLPWAGRCRSCGAQLDVDVPAGIHDGQRIRIRGEGHAGARWRPRQRLRRRARAAGSPVRARRRRPPHGASADDDRGGARHDGARSDARRRRASWTFRPGRSRARCASCTAAGCPRCTASARATCTSGSTSPSRRASTRSSARCSRTSRAAPAPRPTRASGDDEGFLSRLKSALR